jgi:prefoldin subunit 5
MKKKKSKVLVSDPVQELADATEALNAMKQNVKLATKAIADKGLFITTQITDSHGKFVTVERINPALKAQREALRAINVLKRQIEQLQKEVKEVQQPKSAWDMLKEAGKVS